MAFRPTLLLVALAFLAGGCAPREMIARHGFGDDYGTAATPSDSPFPGGAFAGGYPPAPVLYPGPAPYSAGYGYPSAALLPPGAPLPPTAFDPASQPAPLFPASFPPAGMAGPAASSRMPALAPVFPPPHPGRKGKGGEPASGTQGTGR